MNMGLSPFQLNGLLGNNGKYRCSNSNPNLPHDTIASSLVMESKDDIKLQSISSFSLTHFIK